MTPRIHWPWAAPGLNRLSEEASHHLIRVLRLQVGASVCLFNGRGEEGIGTIQVADARACELELPSLVPVPRESPVRSIVLQSLCLGDKMDWVVQKASELGAAKVWPIWAARSQVQLSGDRAAKRVTHWQKVAEAAAAQCGRNEIPQVLPITSLAAALEAFQAAPAGRAGWLLDPFAQETVGTSPLPSEVWIAIGPEAGWTDCEERAARDAGFRGLRMGPRILRTETVAPAILSVLAARTGEF